MAVCQTVQRDREPDDEVPDDETMQSRPEIGIHETEQQVTVAVIDIDLASRDTQQATYLLIKEFGSKPAASARCRSVPTPAGISPPHRAASFARRERSIQMPTCVAANPPTAASTAPRISAKSVCTGPAIRSQQRPDPCRCSDRAFLEGLQVHRVLQSSERNETAKRLMRDAQTLHSGGRCMRG